MAEYKLKKHNAKFVLPEPLLYGQWLMYSAESDAREDDEVLGRRFAAALAVIESGSYGDADLLKADINSVPFDVVVWLQAVVDGAFADAVAIKKS